MDSSKNTRCVAANDRSMLVAWVRRLRGVRGVVKSSESWDVDVTYTESVWVIFGVTCGVDVVVGAVEVLVMPGMRACSRAALTLQSWVMSFLSSMHWRRCFMRRHRLRSFATSTC